MTTEIGRIYRGDVQGVGFRATAQRVAHTHDIRGWVRNETDGSVRLVAAGSEDAIVLFQSGIEHALGDRIHAVEPFEPDDTPAPHPFEVRQ